MSESYEKKVLWNALNIQCFHEDELIENKAEKEEYSCTSAKCFDLQEEIWAENHSEF